MTRFLFISPPYERLKGLTLQSASLGLLYLATSLDRAGYRAKVYDADTVFNEKNSKYGYTNIGRAMSQAEYIRNLNDDNHPAWQDIKELLLREKPDFVGIGMMTAIFSSCRKVARIVRENLPDAVIMAGGAHITILLEKALEKLPEVDVGFVGEAEESIVEFADEYTGGGDWRSVKGIIFRRGGSLHFSGQRPRIENLDDLPIPDRNLIVNVSRYPRIKLASMIASRGCPFQCTFCASVPLWERKVKMRSPENLLKEIDYLVENFNISTFGFWDDTFTIDKEATIKFCRLIYRKYGRRKFNWNCLTNINCIDDKLLFWLKMAGCKTISIGVESGSDRILKLVKKGITTDSVRRAVKLIKKRRFWLLAFFMVGIPYETEEDIRKTIDFIKEIRPDSINLCTFTPHPGTELYDYVIRNGKFKVDENFTVYDHIAHHSMENFFVDGMSRERYGQLVTEILQLSTEMSKINSIHKVMLLIDRLTWEKVKRRLK